MDSPIDHRADIFAFGVLLQEMIAGHQAAERSPLHPAIICSAGHWRAGRALHGTGSGASAQSMGDVLAALEGSSRAAPRRWAVGLAPAWCWRPSRHLFRQPGCRRGGRRAHPEDGRSPGTGLQEHPRGSAHHQLERGSADRAGQRRHVIDDRPQHRRHSRPDGRIPGGHRPVPDRTARCEAALNELGVALLLDLALERRAADGFRMHARLHRTGDTDPVTTGAYDGDVPAIHRALMADLPRLLATGGFNCPLHRR